MNDKMPEITDPELTWLSFANTAAAADDGYSERQREAAASIKALQELAKESEKSAAWGYYERQCRRARIESAPHRRV